MTTNDTLTILLIEDDPRLASLTKEYLEGHGAVVSHTGDGASGLADALRHDYDVVLLDLMLPTMDGIEICRRIRERKDTPIIMITARGEEADRVLGLEIGADDYVPKPFSPRELLARIHALVRRTRGQAGPKTEALTVGDLYLDPSRAQAKLEGKPVDLTTYEFSLLYALAANAGRVLDRDRLMELARGNAEEAFDRSIDVHISRLRKKLGDSSSKSTRIKTLRGLGYMYIDGDL